MLTASLAAAIEIHTALTSNISLYLSWSLIQDWGWINAAGEPTKKGFLAAHYAKFVRPGYRRLALTFRANNKSRLLISAFLSANTTKGEEHPVEEKISTVVWVVINLTDQSEQVRLSNSCFPRSSLWHTNSTVNCLSSSHVGPDFEFLPFSITTILTDSVYMSCVHELCA